MGWAATDQGGTGRCRNHPNHTQSGGVCSSCLTEKLAKLSSMNRNLAGAGEGSCSSSGTNSPPYSSRSSTYLSPAGRGRHNRNESEVMGSISFMVSVSDGLKKSRSVAYVPRNRVGEGKGAKKVGFWSKLLRSTAKRNNRDVLMHSRNNVTVE